jgi:hypothetical protein
MGKTAPARPLSILRRQHRRRRMDVCLQSGWRFRAILSVVGTENSIHTENTQGSV